MAWTSSGTILGQAPLFARPEGLVWIEVGPSQPEVDEGREWAGLRYGKTVRDGFGRDRSTPCAAYFDPS